MEEDLIKQIVALEEEKKSIYLTMSLLRKSLLDAETKAIGIKLEIDRTNELLRLFKSREVDTNITDREIVIGIFRAKMPELLNKLPDELKKT